MLPQLAEMKQVARGMARRTAVLAAGGALMFVGGGFVVAALWIGLEDAFGAIAATLVVAILLLGLGLLVFGLAPREPRLIEVAPPLRKTAHDGRLFQHAGALPPMVDAFLFGLAIAMQIRNNRR